MSEVQTCRVSSFGRISLPANVRRRWQLDGGGEVEVLDLGFAVLTMPLGGTGRLLGHLLPADVHHAMVAADDDPDLRTA